MKSVLLILTIIVLYSCGKETSEPNLPKEPVKDSIKLGPKQLPVDTMTIPIKPCPIC